uniref:Uncharacterized protein n=1 Tax=Arundo donax TaxID=35708 RepID=A0A0A9BPJ3_ARUDO
MNEKSKNSRTSRPLFSHTSRVLEYN